MADGNEAAIQALTQGLAKALGDNLVSLMLYGSVARGDHVAGRSDINVLLVVRDASATTLHAASPVLGSWLRVAHAPPLIQSEADWSASADVFPIEIEEIRDAHRLLAGRDVVGNLKTDRSDLRRQLEHDARGKLVRLRAEYAAAAADGKVLAELLARATGTFLVLFRATLRLAGRPVPADATAVVREAAVAAGFDAAPFEWALGARLGAKAPSLKPYDETATAYIASVQKLVDWVDKQ
ncbi:MAG TPA: hypothetical protein VGI92_10590 [Gemmatimonadales bacterium]|jgi:predicted nucleotidyltransferase